MPAKKTKPGAKKIAPAEHHNFLNIARMTNNEEFIHKLFMTFFGVLLVYIIVWFGASIRNELREYDFIGRAETLERTITIEAEGRATAKPDIAKTSMGVVSQGDTVEDAQTENTARMNALLTGLRGLGIEKADIQTQNYNIYPRYDYTDEGREARGFEVSQNVTIKIRDLDIANSVFALAGKVGANSVGGLDFTLDDRQVYVDAARENALQKVGKKADALARSLGVDLGDVVGYDEFEGGFKGPFLEARSLSFDSAVGGAPEIEAGSTDVRLNVSVTFMIR